MIFIPMLCWFVVSNTDEKLSTTGKTVYLINRIFITVAVLLFFILIEMAIQLIRLLLLRQFHKSYSN